MTELKNNLIEILEDSSYAPFTFEELADISKIEKETLKELLIQLKEENIVYYPNKKELIENVNSLLKEGDCVLIKASRKYKFEEIFEAIK